MEKTEHKSCCKCNCAKDLTGHHVLPKRFLKKHFKKNYTNFLNDDDVVTLCRQCHDIIEEIILELERKADGDLEICDYFLLIVSFIVDEIDPQPDADILLSKPKALVEKNGILLGFIRQSVDYLAQLKTENERICPLDELLYVCENYQ
jgi:hypothetical protein